MASTDAPELVTVHLANGYRTDDGEHHQRGETVTMPFDEGMSLVRSGLAVAVAVPDGGQQEQEATA